ncbi:MAG: folate-binding protein [Rhodanobacter lindaniclasticus]
MHASPIAETLLLEGPEAGAFAHAQFSSRVDGLAVGHWQFSAWLDAKGRVRALFHLARLEEQRYLLLLRGGDAATMVDALQRFVFRAQLRLTALPARSLSTGPMQALHAVTMEDDVVSLGCGSHALLVSTATSTDDAWRALQLCEGWPWLPAPVLGTLLPAALSLQRLNAVAVDKGCYPGQEIVARLHFRGGHKRHLHCGTTSQSVHAGEALRIDDREVGCVLDVVDGGSGFNVLLVLDDDVATQLRAGATPSFQDALALTLQTSWPA